MNRQPVSYLQTDPRWKDKPYQVDGKETTTIGASGCGPTCAAMLIETLCGFTYTPEDACYWSVTHGYKAVGQGTYYSYFVPQFKIFNIACQQLNSANLYGNAGSSVHDKAFELLKQGYYLIACMGKGAWTSSGHFVVVWWEDGKVRINDPASTKEARLNGNLATFRSQVKYYWAIDAREFNGEETPEKEEDESVVRYNKLSDIPEAYDFQNIINMLMNAGIIEGDGSDPDGNDDVIDLSQDMVRLLIFNYRAGCYDEKIQEAGYNPDLYK